MGYVSSRDHYCLAALDHLTADMVSMSSMSLAGTGTGWVNTVPTSTKKSTFASSKRSYKKPKVGGNVVVRFVKRIGEMVAVIMLDHQATQS